MRITVLSLTLFLGAGCAPSADLRIAYPEAPLTRGRLVVVPVGPAGHNAFVDPGDGVPGKAGFSSDADHEAAFWSALVARLGDALDGMEVRLGAPADRAHFVERRVLLQGEAAGYGRNRWTVERMALPVPVDADSVGADYVLFLEDVQTTTDLGRHTFRVPLGRFAVGMTVPEVGVGVSARAVLVRCGSEAPILAHVVGGAEGGDGLLGTAVNRDVWDQAVERFALRVAEAADGRGR